jgi:hypothetical protein
MDRTAEFMPLILVCVVLLVVSYTIPMTTSTESSRLDRINKLTPAETKQLLEHCAKDRTTHTECYKAIMESRP